MDVNGTGISFDDAEVGQNVFLSFSVAEGIEVWKYIRNLSENPDVMKSFELAMISTIFSNLSQAENLVNTIILLTAVVDETYQVPGTGNIYYAYTKK